MAKLSIIILKTREKDFNRCIASVKRSLSISDIDYEILIISYSPILSESNNIKNILTSNLNISYRRNLGISESSGDFICFIDDDVIVPEPFFSNFSRLSRFNGPDIFSGPDISYPVNSLQSSIQKLFVENIYLNGFKHKMRFSHPHTRIMLPSQGSFTNIFIKKELFLKLGMLKNNYPVCEDTLFLYKAEKNGSYMLFSNDLYVFHKRKTSLLEFLKQMFYFGKYNLILYFEEMK